MLTATTLLALIAAPVSLDLLVMEWHVQSEVNFCLKPISNPVVFIFILSNLKALRIQIGSWCDDLESQCNPLYFRFILRLLAGCFIYFQISKRTAATKWCYYLQCSVFLSFLGTERQICLLDNISKKLNKYLGEKEKKQELFESSANQFISS